MLVDSHAHLQWPTVQPILPDLLSRADAAGVRRILTLGTDLASSQAALSISDTTEAVYAAVGLHPGDLEIGRRDLDDLVVLMADPRVVAVGEIGLDYYHQENAPRTVQIEAFETQLDAAARLGKPVSIHNREATNDMLGILKRYAGRMPIVLHCFSGNPAQAEEAVEMGCYLSFAGNVTYPRNDVLRHVAAKVPADRVLLETDTPFLSPQGWRGKPNEPAHVSVTYDVVAAARSTSRTELEAVVARNAATIFGWGE